MARQKTVLKPPFLHRISFTRRDEMAGYPFNIDLFQRDFALDIEKPVLIFSGENGSGKSTLLEAIAVNAGFNVSGGNRNHLFAQSADVAPLAKAMRFSWRPRVSQGFFMRAESFFNFSSYIDELTDEDGPRAIAPYGGKSLHEQSHGEAFLSLFRNKFTARGLYLLDEPEAALSPMRQLSLLSILHDMERSKACQVIMSTHSPILMAYPGAQFMYLADGKLSAQDYKATEHYRVTRRFLENPEAMLRELITE